MSTKNYTSDAIDVSYDPQKCIHAAECVRGLPAVFNTRLRPWVQPWQADADVVAEIVERCPTGALHYRRKDGGADEAVEPANTVVVTPNGPYYLRGDLRLAEGQAPETRLALCRCGASANKPFCDNSHRQVGFRDPGRLARQQDEEAGAGGPLEIKPQPNRSLRLVGPLEIRSFDGNEVYRCTAAVLCRCGHSHEKPFCDATHRSIGFKTEAQDGTGPAPARPCAVRLLRAPAALLASAHGSAATTGSPSPSPPPGPRPAIGWGR